jgi:hypothetical protein
VYATYGQSSTVPTFFTSLTSVRPPPIHTSPTQYPRATSTCLRCPIPANVSTCQLIVGGDQRHVCGMAPFARIASEMLRLLTRRPSRGFLLSPNTTTKPAVCLIAVTRGCLHHHWIIMRRELDLCGVLWWAMGEQLGRDATIPWDGGVLASLLVWGNGPGDARGSSDTLEGTILVREGRLKPRNPHTELRQQLPVHSLTRPEDDLYTAQVPATCP